MKTRFLLLLCWYNVVALLGGSVWAQQTDSTPAEPRIQLGVERTEQYLPLLAGKRVALVVNQTSMLGQRHLVDTLQASGVAIQKVFAPEHGFRGTADAGQKISNTTDAATGLPIISLYGKTRKPTPAMLDDVDVLVFDMQDVGARFYTYIATLQYLIEAAAENRKTLIVLDRPNPNGHYIDGPVLQPLYKSFVGLCRIPVVHGLTVGELAQMINGERWAGTQACSLVVVPCLNYTHNTAYVVPIKPSPNLPNEQAIYLYPSLCFFEGTVVSVGRGTDQPFQLIGAPLYRNMPYSFSPTPHEGAMLPPYNGETCLGYDLSHASAAELRNRRAIDLQWLLTMYRQYPDKEHFFSNAAFFDKLAGNGVLREQIVAQLSEAEIRQTWQADLTAYKILRRQYLLYPDFE